MRIIAGSAKGRKIELPAGMHTRPTLARVKEALFGSIQFDLPGSLVLDLFSGSGNLGLEAASRGARLVYLNDHDAACIRCIERNAEALKLRDNTRILQADYRSAIGQLQAQGLCFDIIFLDAPYADGAAQDAAERLFSADMVAENGYVVVEHAWNLPPRGIAGLMRSRKTRKYGDCGLTVLERDTTP